MTAEPGAAGPAQTGAVDRGTAASSGADHGTAQTDAAGPATATSSAAAMRQLPALEPETAFFWTGGAESQLKICRCAGCGSYIHPPLPNCPECGGAQVSPSPVSGRARVASFTVNHQRWVPGLSVPFVFAAVELVEQAELYVFTNIVGCPVEDVRIGMAVGVVFEQHGDIFLPMFQPLEGTHVR